ncbi:uncharacterized protein DUF2490 [Neolewinella xylanilytica]|uniref:Uncharacterized protein DUF2490 n=1 Tax=Neolewinella xylanilytica TaxID=1514080 RepID=A0A2S6IA93_9BACT|nr:DUF2490 domain-containing protein [Neolewinella xylanilytica]PPK88423.1 uncharacterized protein DUF2490 [Neolewinella xylanilytica]
MKYVFYFLLCLIVLPLSGQSAVDEDKLGAWYMYFYSHSFGDGPWGIQGDAQYRNWNLGGDLEQLLLRSGLTYSPTDAGITFTLGYANVTSGAYGDSDATSGESRIYQEALFPQRIGGRFLLTHRLRYEQRWVEGQDVRTRYRYNLFVNVPLNATDLGKGVINLALYNEVFLNGQLDIGDGRSVQYFDRNRLYLGLAYGITDRLRTQLGWMRQTTVAVDKAQLQVSLHHSW